MRLYRPTWKDKEGKRRRSARWWLDFTDGNGRRLRFPGLTDRRQTEALGVNVEKLIAVKVSGDSLPAELLRRLEALPTAFRQRLAKADLIDRERASGLAVLMVLDADNKVIGGHLADFLADAEARGVSPTQRQMLAQRIRDTLQRAGAKWLRDLSASRMQAAVASFGAPTEDRPNGLGRQSLQHYTRAVKQFSKWLQRERRTAEDSLVGMKGYNAETDKRHERRGFTADEMVVLLETTRQAPDRWGMTGKARAVADLLAFNSGLRRNEIRTLTRASFDLDANPPTVTVEAAYSKHRRTDVQPLPADVAGMLSDYLAEADGERPFPLPGKSGKMLHEDMADARRAWIEAKGLTEAQRKNRQNHGDFLMPRDSAGLVLDFHSFRHGYVTAICRANVSPRVMMELARHSDPRLTMKRYSRVAAVDMAKALDVLPKLAVRAKDAAEETVLRKTGTTDSAEVENRFATRFAKSCRFDRISMDSAGRTSEKADVHNTLETRGKTASIKVETHHTPVAQLDSASVFGTEGCRFESCRACCGCSI